MLMYNKFPCRTAFIICGANEYAREFTWRMISLDTQPIISFQNFGFQYTAQAEPTLYDINLDIHKGEKILIAGPSGCGKSTLTHCINGLIPIS